MASRLLSSWLFLLAILHPGSAVAATSGSTADFSITQYVYEGTVPMGDAGTPWTGPDLLIGDTVTVKWIVARHGPDPVPYTFQYVFPSGKNQFHQPAHVYGGYTDDDCEYGRTATSVTLTCPGYSNPLYVYAYFTGNAPADLPISATVSSSESDPDVSNNSAGLDATVVCSINGSPLDDVLRGTSSVDSICAGDGNDHLTAVGSDDKLFGQDGNDLFDGTGGINSGQAIGGSGEDTVTYANADRAIIICVEREDYATNLNSWAPNSLVEIERFVGSPFGDLMEGTNGDDALVGRGGADRLMGLGGSDELYGGGGDDKFVTRDQEWDVVRGGRGTDRGRVDASDALYSVKAVSTRLFSNPCAG